MDIPPYNPNRGAWSPASMNPPAGAISQIGHYNIIKTIGKGQFGSVKLAVHSLTNERVRFSGFLHFYFSRSYCLCLYFSVCRVNHVFKRR